MADRRRRRARASKRRSAEGSKQRAPSPAAPAQERPAEPARAAGPERPHAPWHPLPLSELLILVGGAAVLFAVLNGPAHSLAALFAGLAAVAIGTIEVTLREHFSGYRSHALLLALLPVVVLHSVIVLLVTLPRAANLGLLVIDIAIVFVLFRFLRARYVDARRRAALARRAGPS